MAKEIIALVPTQGNGNTCEGCALHRDHRPGAPLIDEGCNFRKLCGTGQFTARLLDVDRLTLRELPHEE